LNQLADNPGVFRVHYDRPISKFNARTSLTVGTRAVQDTLGLTGAGIGIAVVDSGITAWHDDLTNRSSTLYPYGDQRVAAFVDFVNGQIAPYDDSGHGSHVAGIIAGNGHDSKGLKAGAAPEASLIALKVLDADGNGTISNIIAALDWTLAHHATYNIRIVNLSVGAAVRESYWTDPLTIAAKRVVDAGVVVVASAGNFGRNADGLPQYGGITAPGNAPWVLTVGASTTNGTITRTDDETAGYSSRGPTYLDWSAKPDLLAPGTGTVSLAVPGSTLYSTKPQLLLPGLVDTASAPYLLGQPHADRRRAVAERQRMEPRNQLGRGEDRRRRQHRVGHHVRRCVLRQHRLGNRERRGQHRLGHDGRRRQHRVGDARPR
jgi:serine protease AprX